MKRLILFFMICLGMTSLLHAQTMDTIKHNGMTRSYMVHVPATYDGESPTPLVVAIHGWQRSPQLMEDHSRLSVKSDSCGFLVVYPKGTGNPLGWNVNESGVDDVGFIDCLLDTLQKDYNIDARRIYVTGFSNGSQLTYRIAHMLANRIAAIAPVAGPMLFSSHTPARAVPVMHFHAKNDNSAPYSGVKPVLNYWINNNDCSTEPDTFFTNAGATGIRWAAQNGDADVIHYVTKIGGHSWPGGKTSWATPSQAISATDLMWDFFSAHTLTETSTEVSSQSSLPENFIMEPNFPNPFNPETRLRYTLPENGPVTLNVYDLLGRHVETLVDEYQSAGQHTVRFNGMDKASGIYLYKITFENDSQTGRMSLVK